jgi:hypothetical protein
MSGDATATSATGRGRTPGYQPTIVGPAMSDTSTAASEPEVPRRLPPAAQLAILAAAFAVGVGVATIFGAINLGVAFGVGQLFFAAALVWVLLR